MTISLELSQIKHPDYVRYEARWRLIRDVVGGKEEIDRNGLIYIPKPEGYSAERYLNYLIRAVLYNATSRTLDGYLGAVFRKEAEVVIPEELNYLIKDADGQGNTLNQFTKQVTKDVIGWGRHGILVDYPMAEGEVTLKEEKDNNLHAYLCSYTPESILNWKTKTVGAKTILTHLLLRQDIEEGDGHQFSLETIPVYRLLELDDLGHYTQITLKEEDVDGVDQLGRKTNKRMAVQQGEVVKPKLRNGEFLDYIPFVFVGSETATPPPDLPPLYDLAQLNLAHYRNSVEWEQAIFMAGQPTPWIVGVDDDFIEENRGHMVFGSGAVWLLPEGAMVGMLEPKVDKNLILKGMEHKESEMVGLGARIVLDNGARGSESTEGVALRRSGEASQLACIADNVSEAMIKVLSWVAAWMIPEDKYVPEDIKYKLNKDFFGARMTPNELRELVAAWHNGAISQTILLNNLRKGEIISELVTNDEVKEQISEEIPLSNDEDEDDIVSIDDGE